ncbi:hypothetical protein [Micromonospora sp. NPDC005205]|uniref:hypothetical protein n=1 Tax=Micromonospora sp. NPDC005205 TaxID=3156714 RepID=UPI0033A7978D
MFRDASSGPADGSVHDELAIARDLPDEPPDELVGVILRGQVPHRWEIRSPEAIEQLDQPSAGLLRRRTDAERLRICVQGVSQRSLVLGRNRLGALLVMSE